MSLEFETLEPNTTFGSGYVGIRFRYVGLNANACKCSIQRIGYQEPFLGLKGWQTPSHFFSMFNVENDGSKLFFVLEPWAIQHMRNSSNYRFGIHDAKDTELGFDIVHWHRVPSFREKSAVNARIIEPAPEAEKLSPAVDRVGEEPGCASWSYELAAKEISPQNEIAAEYAFAHPHDDTASTDKDSQHEDMVPSVHLNRNEQPVSALVCPHDPSHKIFSNMVFCPLCGKPV